MYHIDNKLHDYSQRLVTIFYTFKIAHDNYKIKKPMKWLFF